MNTVLSVVVPAYNEAKTIASKLKRVLAQLSHDLAASRPLDDFVVNAVGALNFLKATRRFRIASPFVHMPTKKIFK
jgi:CDP-paratose 2-epimerase